MFSSTCRQAQPNDSPPNHDHLQTGNKTFHVTLATRSSHSPVHTLIFTHWWLNNLLKKLGKRIHAHSNADNAASGAIFGLAQALFDMQMEPAAPAPPPELVGASPHQCLQVEEQVLTGTKKAAFCRKLLWEREMEMECEAHGFHPPIICFWDSFAGDLTPDSQREPSDSNNSSHLHH